MLDCSAHGGHWWKGRWKWWSTERQGKANVSRDLWGEATIARASLRESDLGGVVSGCEKMPIPQVTFQ